MLRFQAEAGTSRIRFSRLACYRSIQKIPCIELHSRFGGPNFHNATVDWFICSCGVSQCARCHVCDGTGRNFGPDLTGISRKWSRGQLLEQIIHPSKLVAPEFKTTIVTLKDDTELSGFVLRRTVDEIRLRDEMLTERTFKAGEIKETRESALSAMPEGLLAPLTAHEAADLLEYLATSKVAPASTK